MKIIYPVLIGEIAKRGIKKSAIATQINISVKSLYNKLSGVTPFTWDEVCKINSCFFPDMDKNDLFSSKTDSKSA